MLPRAALPSGANELDAQPAARAGRQIPLWIAQSGLVKAASGMLRPPNSPRAQECRADHLPNYRHRWAKEEEEKEEEDEEEGEKAKKKGLQLRFFGFSVPLLWGYTATVRMTKAGLHKMCMCHMCVT